MRYLLIFIFLSPFLIHAQDVRVPGQVVDINNNPIENASINVVGINSNAVSDATGIFSLLMPTDIKKGNIITIRVKKEGYNVLSKHVSVSPLVVIIKLIKIKGYKSAVVKYPSNEVKNQPITTITGGEQHIVSGTGNSVGVNGNINNGVKQRHLTDAVLTYLLISLPDKKAKINFLWAGGKEGQVYAEEIFNALVNRGYSNLSPSHWMDPDGYDKVFVTKQNDQLQLRIYPVSDVQ